MITFDLTLGTVRFLIMILETISNQNILLCLQLCGSSNFNEVLINCVTYLHPCYYLQKRFIERDLMLIANCSAKIID